MAYLEYSEISYVKETGDPSQWRYLTIGFIIHWLEDSFNSTCNDTWTFVTLSEDEIVSALSKFDDNVDAGFVTTYLKSMEEEVLAFNHENHELSDYAKMFVNSIQVDKPRNLTVVDQSGEEDDEVAPGIFVEQLIDELEDAFATV